MHVSNGFEDVVLNGDEGHRLAGNGVTFGHNPGQDITYVAGGFTDGHHEGPILPDEADDAAAGHIFCGEYTNNAGQLRGRAHIQA